MSKSFSSWIRISNCFRAERYAISFRLRMHRMRNCWRSSHVWFSFLCLIYSALDEQNLESLVRWKKTGKDGSSEQPGKKPQRENKDSTNGNIVYHHLSVRSLWIVNNRVWWKRFSRIPIIDNKTGDFIHCDGKKVCSSRPICSYNHIHFSLINKIELTRYNFNLLYSLYLTGNIVLICDVDSKWVLVMLLDV